MALETRFIIPKQGGDPNRISRHRKRGKLLIHAASIGGIVMATVSSR